MTVRSLFVVCGILALAACDTAQPDPTPPGVPPPTPDPATAPLQAFDQRAAFPDDPGFVATLFEDAGIVTRPRPTTLDAAALSVERAGLWASGQQGGVERAAIVFFGASNFDADCGTGADRLFALDADTTYTDDADLWPRDLGAPVTSEGAPRVYGDQMLWGSFCTAPADASSTGWAVDFQDPLRDLRLNMALYRYGRDDLAGVRFIRYELTNDGPAPITDLSLGHFADTETPGTYPVDDDRGLARYSNDAVAYDEAVGLSYVYQLPTRAGTGGQTSVSSAWVSGLAVLATATTPSVFAHRIFNRFTAEEPAGFGEAPRAPAQAANALAGLSWDGAPMIDPRTGLPSRFAFPTNPFVTTTSGWLDGRDEAGVFQGRDVRQLLSLAPTTLGTGETLTVTIAVVTSEAGPTSFDSFQEVQQTLAAVRAEPSLWRFTPGS